MGKKISAKKTSSAKLPCETAPQRRGRASKAHRLLKKMYPDAECALVHRNPFELLVATILSAQCTDKRVNMVTPALFEKYPTASKMARAKPAELETLIRSTGFYRNKTKNILGAAQRIVQEHDHEAPQTMRELLELPGVARKTANVVLGNAFNKNEGMVVDTHIGRLSRRLGWTAHTNPVKVEQDLMALFERKSWRMLAHLLIEHGRSVCSARKPKCEQCELQKHCPQIGV